MSKKDTSALSGKALLQKVKELSNLPKREIARQCGYATANRKGESRVNLSGFYSALLEARGVLESEQPQRRGREATFKTSVQKNGQVLIGATYTKMMGLVAGDEFVVKVGYKNIHLVKRGAEEEEA